ncbi:MAG TPA: hypothetical protein VFK22_04945 [Candidatus Dormibacteraeota bacterium]|nr:hypothetical protein [Candidatus Dormibacteraeota bacterium]
MARAKTFRPPELKRSGVLARVQQQRRWGAERANEAEEWYRRHLRIAFERGGKPVYVIHRDADVLWHTHITFTKAYRDYCLDVFGEFLDHTPLPPGGRPPSAAVIAAGLAEYKKRDWFLKKIWSGTGCH